MFTKIKTSHGLALLGAVFLLAVTFINWSNQQLSSIFSTSSIILSPRSQLAQVSGAGSGLVGWWKFDEGNGTTANDSSGGSSTATLVNGPTWTTGKIGGALNFDGVNGSVNLGSDPLGTGSISVSMWVYARSPGSNNGGRLFTNGNFDLYIPNANRVYFTSDGNKTDAASAAGSIPFGVWKHVVVTRTNAGIANIYIDGSLSGAADQPSGTPITGTFNPIIGNHQVNRTWDGYIDDLRVYNRALSPGEVSQLYSYTGSAPAPAAPGSLSLSDLPSPLVSGNQYTVTWTSTNIPAGNMISAGISGPSFGVGLGQGANTGSLQVTIPNAVPGNCELAISTSVNGTPYSSKKPCTIVAAPTLTPPFHMQPLVTPPDLVITDITADQYYVYVSYMNKGGAGPVGLSGQDFLVKASTNKGSFGGNPYYRFPVPTPGQTIKTGGFTLGLLGLKAGDTSNVTAMVDWEGRIPESDETNNSFSKTITVPGSVVTTYNLQTSIVGSGTLTSLPTGISCPGACSSSYTSGTSLTLTATPNAGQSFSTWSGCNSVSSNTCTVTMTSNKSVTASFVPAPLSTYSLTVTKQGTGTGTVTSSGGSINCGSTCSVSGVPSGIVSTLTATPLSGSTFTGWSVNPAGAGSCPGTNPCTITMTANTTVTATFTGTVVGAGPTYYIDFQNGNNANSGLTPLTAWKLIPGTMSNCAMNTSPIYAQTTWGAGTIQLVNKKVQPGTTFKLKPGTVYDGTKGGCIWIRTDFYSNATAANPIRFELDTTQGSGNVVIDGGGMGANSSITVSIVLIQVDGIQFDGKISQGIVMRNSPIDGVQVKEYPDGSAVRDCVFKNIYFFNNGTSFLNDLAGSGSGQLNLRKVDGCILDNLEFNGNHVFINGLIAGDNHKTVLNTTIKNSKAYDHKGDPVMNDAGIGFKILNGQVTISNVTSYNNLKGLDLGEQLSDGSPIVYKVINNLVYGNMWGINFNDSGEITSPTAKFYLIDNIIRDNVIGSNIYSGPYNLYVIHNVFANNGGATSLWPSIWEASNIQSTSDGCFDQTPINVYFYNNVFYKPLGLRNFIDPYVGNGTLGYDTNYTLNSDYNSWVQNASELFSQTNAFGCPSSPVGEYTYGSNGPGHASGLWYTTEDEPGVGTGHFHADVHSKGTGSSDPTLPPFTNVSAKDFTLTGPYRGLNLTSQPWYIPEMGVDRNGRARTTWDIGAYDAP